MNILKSSAPMWCPRKSTLGLKAGTWIISHEYLASGGGIVVPLPDAVNALMVTCQQQRSSQVRTQQFQLGGSTLAMPI